MAKMKERKIELNELAYGDVCKRSRSISAYSPDVQEFERELLDLIDQEVSCAVSKVESTEE